MKILKWLEKIIMVPIAKGFFKSYGFITKKIGVDWGAREEDF